MKKIFGIALALALVLSMGVMATPVAAGTIVCAGVTQTNPLTGGASDYTINFTTQEPVAAGEYIDVTFPPTTVLAAGGTATVEGRTTPAGFWVSNVVGIVAADIFGTTLRITVPVDVIAGSVGVVITDVVTNGLQCTQTLCVGTTAETCEDCPTYEIYAYRIDLVAGWNLISLPVIPDDPDIEVVLADLIAGPAVCCTDFEFKVYYYDCTTWYAYNNGSYASLTTINECKAYWIWVSENISFYVKGSYYPAPPGPPLKKCYHECWNMVGFTSDVTREPFTNNVGAPPACDQPHDLSPYFGSLAPPATIIYVLRWDTGLQTWGAVIQWTALPDAAAPNSNCLTPGEGYWVAFSADACFAPPPPGV